MPIYHMDWVASALIIVGQWFVYKKRWWGWVFCVLGNCAFLYVNTAFRIWGAFPVSLFSISIGAWSAWHWRRRS